jgi:hypothetical protein
MNAPYVSCPFPVITFGFLVKLTKKYGGLISTVICAIPSPTQHGHPTYTQASLLFSLCFEMGFMQTFLRTQAAIDSPPIYLHLIFGTLQFEISCLMNWNRPKSEEKSVQLAKVHLYQSYFLQNYLE